MTKGIFIITSPFQLLCAHNAIKEYGINDSNIVLFSGLDRTAQMLNYMQEVGLSYTLVPFSDLANGTLFKRLYNALFKGRDSYEYLFVGDFRALSSAFYGLSLVKKTKKFVFLDDGNIMISFLAGSYKMSILYRLQKIVFSCCCSLKGIEGVEFFTVFNIPSKERIKLNPLSQINPLKKVTGQILFLGTNSTDYYLSCNLKKEEYLSYLFNALKDLKRSKDIVYIAHGRETLNEVKIICEQLKIPYQIPNVCVEFYLMNNGIYPQEVYSFGSSALYTIKLLFPETSIFNLQVKDEYAEVSDYYYSQGITRFIPQE